MKKEPAMPITVKQKKFYEKMGWDTKFVTKRMAIKKMADLFENNMIKKKKQRRNNIFGKLSIKYE